MKTVKLSSLSYTVENPTLNSGAQLVTISLKGNNKFAYSVKCERDANGFFFTVPNMKEAAGSFSFAIKDANVALGMLKSGLADDFLDYDLFPFTFTPILYVDRNIGNRVRQQSLQKFVQSQLKTVLFYRDGVVKQDGQPLYFKSAQDAFKYAVQLTSRGCLDAQCNRVTLELFSVKQLFTLKESKQLVYNLPYGINVVTKSTKTSTQSPVSKH